MARRFFNITSAIHAIIQHDDTYAFEFIFDAFYEKLMRVAHYYLENESLAEDAVADVFVKLWSGRTMLQKVNNLDNYLFTMTKNQCLTFLRSAKNKTFPESQETLNQQIVLENPESHLIAEEFISYYNKKVNELPAKCKLVYMMVKEDGMKYKEVADLLSISVKTVENQMTKAMSHIRKCLAQYKSYHLADDLLIN